MRLFGLSLVLALLGLGLASREASAADYYVVYEQTKGADPTVELIDPATIATAPDGNRTVRAADITSMQTWNDDKIEFDCAGGRIRYLSSQFHMGSETVDRMQSVLTLADWGAPKPSDVGGLLLKTVCNWSPGMMTGSAVYAAPDFPTAAAKISDRLDKLENQKK